jgi:hypothetical protein
MGEYFFPPRSWLGFGLDMTLASPTDINSISNCVLRASRILKLSRISSSRTVGDTTAKFMAISGSASTHHSITRSFNSSMQYLLFSFSHTMFHAGFDKWDGNINFDALKQRAPLDLFVPPSLTLSPSRLILPCLGTWVATSSVG